MKVNAYSYENYLIRLDFMWELREGILEEVEFR